MALPPPVEPPIRSVHVSGAVDLTSDSGPDQRNPVLSTSVRIGRVAVSYLLVAVGVALLVRGELGVSPFDVLNTGLKDALDVPFSVAFLVSAAVFYATGVALGGRTGWASLIGTFVIAPLIEGALAIVPQTEAMAARVPMFIVGVLVITAAVCLVISTELGPGPGEVFMLGLIARGLPVTWARWITDGLAFLAGFALGGAVGVGTLVFAFAFGPLVAAGLRLLHYTPPVLVVETMSPPDAHAVPARVCCTTDSTGRFRSSSSAEPTGRATAPPAGRHG